jgi:hypothetical protein
MFGESFRFSVKTGVRASLEAVPLKAAKAHSGSRKMQIARFARDDKKTDDKKDRMTKETG